MTSGGQCVMTAGTLRMLLWSAGSWDMHILEVSMFFHFNTYVPLLRAEDLEIDGVAVVLKSKFVVTI